MCDLIFEAYLGGSPLPNPRQGAAASWIPAQT